MVIGYNPSHTNVNSEVNAPFKILSIMLRYLENELNPKKHKKQIPQDYGDNEEEEKLGSLNSYKMQRRDGERLDTVEGDDDGNDYGDERGDTGNEVEKIEATLDDVEDDDDNESLLGLSGKKAGGSLSG
jgi:hypothetical protein